MTSFVNAENRELFFQTDLSCSQFSYSVQKKLCLYTRLMDCNPIQLRVENLYTFTLHFSVLNNNLDQKKGMMLRNLPFSCIERLGEKLNSQRAVNWKNVAAEVGVTAEQISIYNLEPKSATQCLLSDWSTRQDSTVNRLYAILLPLRPDAAEILEPHLTFGER